MIIKNLKDVSLNTIADCFNAAFADYIISAHVTPEYLKERWRAARVDYELSFGVFADSNLVGFIIQGVDGLNGKKTAFNAATGIIPAYRGNRLVQKMYDYALPLLKAAGVEQCSLEVICENEKAVKVYQYAGFSILRELQSFSGEVDLKAESSREYVFKRIEQIHWEHYQHLCLYQPSWEHRKEAIELLTEHIQAWEMYYKGRLQGYMVIKPEKGYIIQFGLEQENFRYAGGVLFAKAAKIAKKLNIINVDTKAEDVLSLLQEVGLKKTVRQYEMLRPLS